MSRFWGLWQKFFGFGREAGEIEKMVSALEERVRLLEERYGRDRDGPKPEPSPVIVEQLYVDKLTVDKVELNNNIGSVGIKELSGVLNIGANYGGGFLPRENGFGKWQPPPPGENETEEGPAPSFREKGMGRGQVAQPREKKAGRKPDTPQREKGREGKPDVPRREQKREAKPKAPRRGEGTGRAEPPSPAGAEAKKKRPTQGTGPKCNYIYKGKGI